RGGLPLDKVCALTFTEKAANEMVERLRSKIAALVDSGEMQPGTLEKLNDCFIGTIHGFCLQVLKRYGEKIGLPPLFQVDAEESSFFEELFDGRWDRFISGALQSANPAHLRLIQNLGIESLKSIADLLAQRRYRFAKEKDSDTSWLVTELLDQNKLGFKSGRWPNIARLALKNHDRELLLLIADHVKFPIPEWKNALLDVSNCRNDDLHLAIEMLQEGFVDPLIDEYRKLGYMRFDDLIIDTRNLLRDQMQVRKQLKARYQLVLVDEMQDTDPVQYEIFLYLCEKDGTEEPFTLQQLISGKKKLELQERKLFVVGDPKQSIFGFRTADLKAYGRIKDVLATQGVETEPLLDNYRSCPNIVEFTNRLAAQLFENDPPKPSNAKSLNLCEGKPVQDCIRLVEIESDQYDAVHLRVLSEANWLADTIAQLGSYKDIAILLRKLTNAHL